MCLSISTRAEAEPHAFTGPNLNLEWNLWPTATMAMKVVLLRDCEDTPGPRLPDLSPANLVYNQNYFTTNVAPNTFTVEIDMTQFSADPIYLYPFCALWRPITETDLGWYYPMEVQPEGPWVQQLYNMDCDGDGTVGLSDFSCFVDAYSCQPVGPLGWSLNPNCQ